jgi:hypothetical protein
LRMRSKMCVHMKAIAVTVLMLAGLPSPPNNREVEMKRNRLQKRADELRKVRDILSDIDNVSEKGLRNIDVSIFHGDERRCLDEIINRISEAEGPVRHG